MEIRKFNSKLFPKESIPPTIFNNYDSQCPNSAIKSHLIQSIEMSWLCCLNLLNKISRKLNCCCNCIWKIYYLMKCHENNRYFVTRCSAQSNFFFFISVPYSIEFNSEFNIWIFDSNKLSCHFL